MVGQGDENPPKGWIGVQLLEVTSASLSAIFYSNLPPGGVRHGPPFSAPCYRPVRYPDSPIARLLDFRAVLSQR